MDDINDLVAGNLRRLREERRLSLDALARDSGVSKSMLGQIERGIVNPTVSTVWKIAAGLKVHFADLIERAQPAAQVVRRSEVSVLIADEGKYRLIPMFPLDASRRFELYSVELDPGATLRAEAHPPGTEEFVMVFAGALTVTAGETEYVIKTGDALRFKADVTHIYENAGKALCKLAMTIHYAESPPAG